MEGNHPTNSVRISAVIPAYNCARYIARAIESVLNQTHPVDELIVIDDGSSDNTAEVVRSFGDRVTLIQQSNAGASAARNTGIETASGDWIAFLDADDEWLPDKLKLQVALLNKNPNLMWISGNYLRCLCEEHRKKPHLPESVTKKVLNHNGCIENFFTAFAKDVWGHPDTMLIKKVVLKEVGLFRGDLRQMEDIDLFWRIARKYPTMGYVPQPIAIYHLGIEGSLIQSRTDYTAHRRMLREHVNAAKNTECSTDITGCARFMLRRLIRSMLFNRETNEIHQMLTEFSDVLPGWYIFGIRGLTVFPGLTTSILRFISFVLRLFRVRKTLTRKPKKIKM